MTGALRNITLGKMWNEAMVAQFGGLSRHFLGSERNYKKFKIAYVLAKVLPGNLLNIFRSITVLVKYLGNICHVK
jgi:hypothetical protein